MKIPFKKEKSAKEVLIEKWLEDATWHDAGSEEACRATENLVKLMKDENPRKKIDPNTLLEGGFSLASVALLCHFEKVSILPSKAFNLLLKVFKH